MKCKGGGHGDWMILMLTRPMWDFRWLRRNMRAQVLRDVDESASLFFLYCYLREQRLQWLSYSLHRLILYIFTYIINKVSWQIYPGIQADTRTNSSITVFVLALGFLTNEKMWIEWTSERMVNVRTFQNCFQGISGLGVYASGTSKGCGPHLTPCLPVRQKQPGETRRWLSVWLWQNCSIPLQWELYVTFSSLVLCLMDFMLSVSAFLWGLCGSSNNSLPCYYSSHYSRLPDL